MSIIGDVPTVPTLFAPIKNIFRKQIILEKWHENNLINDCLPQMNG